MILMQVSLSLSQNIKEKIFLWATDRNYEPLVIGDPPKHATPARIAAHGNVKGHALALRGGPP